MGEGTVTVVCSHEITFWSSMFRSVGNERIFYDFVVDLFGKGGTQGFSTVQTLLFVALHWAMFFCHM